MLGLVTSTGAAPIDDDLPLLLGALEEAGQVASVVVWDEPAVDWASFEVAILRSTWDYDGRHVEFLEWLRVVEQWTRVWNSPTVARWNTDKRYLAELDGAGVPTVPTEFVPPGASPPPIGERPVVVKPTVGADGRGVARLRGAAVRRHVDRLHAEGLTAMIQPYVDLIDDRGETSLVFLGDGHTMAFSHAISKRATLGRATGREAAAAQLIGPHRASGAELELAATVLASAPVRRLGPLAYARVDLVPTVDGPVLLELELTEPSLYLASAPGAAERAARRWTRLLSSRDR